MTPTPLQYFTLVDTPKEVHAAALALQRYFTQQGQIEWRFCAVADRRLVDKLERELNAAKAENEAMHEVIKASYKSLAYVSPTFGRTPAQDAALAKLQPFIK